MTEVTPAKRFTSTTTQSLSGQRQSTSTQQQSVLQEFTSATTSSVINSYFQHTAPSPPVMLQTTTQPTPLLYNPYNIPAKIVSTEPLSVDDDVMQQAPLLSFNEWTHRLSFRSHHAAPSAKRLRVDDETAMMLEGCEWDDKDVPQVFLWEPIYTELNGIEKSVPPPPHSAVVGSQLERASTTLGRETSALTTSSAILFDKEEWTAAVNRTFQRASAMDKEWKEYLATVAVEELDLSPEDTHLAAQYLWIRRRHGKEGGEHALSPDAKSFNETLTQTRLSRGLSPNKQQSKSRDDTKKHNFKLLRNPNSKEAKPLGVYPVRVGNTIGEGHVIRYTNIDLLPMKRMLDGHQFITIQEERNLLSQYSAPTTSTNPDEPSFLETQTMVNTTPNPNKYAIFEVRSKQNHVLVRNVPTAFVASHHVGKAYKDMSNTLVAEFTPLPPEPERPARHKKLNDVPPQTVVENGSPLLQRRGMEVDEGEEDVHNQINPQTTTQEQAPLIHEGEGDASLEDTLQLLDQDDA